MRNEVNRSICMFFLKLEESVLVQFAITAGNLHLNTIQGQQTLIKINTESENNERESVDVPGKSNGASNWVIHGKNWKYPLLNI